MSLWVARSTLLLINPSTLQPFYSSTLLLFHICPFSPAAPGGTLHGRAAGSIQYADLVARLSSLVARKNESGPAATSVGGG